MRLGVSGKVLLAEKARVALSPDGHGGTLYALAATPFVFFWYPLGERHLPEAVTQQLGSAGLPVQACLAREPTGEEPRPQAFILARKPE